jgi:hypothetical protein
LLTFFDNVKIIIVYAMIGLKLKNRSMIKVSINSFLKGAAILSKGTGTKY